MIDLFEFTKYGDRSDFHPSLWFFTMCSLHENFLNGALVKSSSHWSLQLKFTPTRLGYIVVIYQKFLEVYRHFSGGHFKKVPV